MPTFMVNHDIWGAACLNIWGLFRLALQMPCAFVPNISVYSNISELFSHYQKKPNFFGRPLIPTEPQRVYQTVMILNDLHPGERGRVTGIEGGHCFRQKLALRGVAEGCMLTMISPSHGPVAVEVKGSTLALGRRMGRKIQVVKVE